MAATTSTRQSTTSVETFISALDDPVKRADSQKLIELMAKVTGEPAKLSGTIVCFGNYHYKYDSGHEGDSCLVGFSPRKAEFSIYLMGTYFPEQENSRQALLDKLGKHRIGKACLYVKRLDDIDLGVLRQLIEMSVGTLKQKYPA